MPESVTSVLLSLRRPTAEDVAAAERHLAAVRERYKFVLDSPEAQEAIRLAEEELAELKRRYEAEQRRIAASKEGKARELAAKEEAKRRRQEEAWKALPGVARELEVAAQAYWDGLRAWCSKVAEELGEIERLADKLFEVREKFIGLVRESGEIRVEGRTSGPSEPLRELIRVTREKSGAQKVEPLPDDLRARLWWTVREAAAIGVREAVGPVPDLPAGGPSLAKAKELAEAEQRRRADQVKAWEDHRRRVRELVRKRAEWIAEKARELADPVLQRLRAENRCTEYEVYRVRTWAREEAERLWEEHVRFLNGAQQQEGEGTGGEV